jgi:hypothetical protein
MEQNPQFDKPLQFSVCGILLLSGNIYNIRHSRVYTASDWPTSAVLKAKIVLELHNESKIRTGVIFMLQFLLLFTLPYTRNRPLWTWNIGILFVGFFVSSPAFLVYPCISSTKMMIIVMTSWDRDGLCGIATGHRVDNVGKWDPSNFRFNVKGSGRHFAQC